MYNLDLIPIPRPRFTLVHLDDIAEAFPVQIKVLKKYKGESSIEIVV